MTIPPLPICLELKGSLGIPIQPLTIDRVVRDYGYFDDSIVGCNFTTQVWPAFNDTTFSIVCTRHGMRLARVEVVGRVVFIYLVEVELKRLAEYERTLKSLIGYGSCLDNENARAHIAAIEDKVRKNLGILWSVQPIKKARVPGARISTINKPEVRLKRSVWERLLANLLRWIGS